MSNSCPPTGHARVDVLLQAREQPVLRREDLVRGGVDDREVRGLVRDGVLTRLRRGWYAPSGALTSPERRHVLTALAHQRANALRLRASHHTALAGRGVLLHGVDLETVHLMGGVPGEAGRSRGLVIHEPAPPQCLTVGGSVSDAAALVQTGLLSGPRAFVVSGDDLMRRRGLAAAAIEEAAAALAGSRGMPRLRPWLGRCSALSESVGESLLRCDVTDLGWQVVPQRQIVAGGRLYRADLCLEGTRVLVEFDGVGKYDKGGAAFRAEKAREQALRDAGWVVVRFMWQDLGRLDVIQRRLLAAVAEARRLSA